MTTTPWNLLHHGDGPERRWAASLRKTFPLYEVFWREHVVPLTFRVLNESNIFMRASVPSRLRALGTAHYWIFYNLANAHDVLAASAFPSVARLYDLYAHLSSVSSLKNGMLPKFLDGVHDVLEHYGGKPHGNRKHRLVGYGRETEKQREAADSRVDRYRNWLEHNGGLPLVEGRIPRRPRAEGYDLATVAELLNSRSRADVLRSRFVDARQQALSDLEAVERALNNIWKVVLADFGKIEDVEGYRRDREPRETDKRLAFDPRLTATTRASASPEYLPAGSERTSIYDYSSSAVFAPDPKALSREP